MNQITLHRMTESISKGIRSDWMRMLLLWALSLTLRYLSSLLCLLLFVSVSGAQPVRPRPFAPGEVLQYKVKWSIFRIGTFIIRQEAGTAEEQNSVRVFLNAESTPGLPFIDLFFANHSLLEPESCRSYEFTSEIGRKNPRRFTHRPLSPNQLLLLEQENSELMRADTIRHNVPLFDDPGAFMLLRQLCVADSTTLVHSVMERTVTTTSITFTEETRNLKVARLERPLRCRRFLARAQWSRPDYAGLTGEFEGWVTEDEAAVPVRLEAKILIGSIRLELESVQRAGWPAANLALDQGRD